MSETLPEHDRLDSWKAIGDYLARDIRTVQRWEGQGLPIRRVAGARGASVFAYRSEVDQWLRDSRTIVTPVAPLSETPDEPTAAPAPVSAVTPVLAPAGHRWPYVAGAAVLTVVVLAAVAWRGRSHARADTLRYDVTIELMIATSPDGREVWRFDLPADEKAALPDVPPTITLEGDAPGVLLLTAHTSRRSDGEPKGGLLRWLSPAGLLLRSFAFHDRWTFAGAAFDEPWTLTDADVLDAPEGRRIAVSAHHDTWWPSLVTVLDDRFARHGTFVNSGWVLNVRWLSPDRLAITGFNQAKDAGMLAILDPSHLDGASPDDAGSPFHCDACGAVRPEFYAVFPRSEVNRVTGSRFNGAVFDARRDRVIIHTREAEPEASGSPLSEAIYEFSPSMELQSASYGSDYWSRHRELELSGKLKHTRDQCPERDGPPVIYVWQPATGWRTVRPPRPPQ